jgi:hypothetical protein
MARASRISPAAAQLAGGRHRVRNPGTSRFAVVPGVRSTRFTTRPGHRVTTGQLRIVPWR